MTPEQRDELNRLCASGVDIDPAWARIILPSERREYELAYRGKEREEDILANTLAVPLQDLRTFGVNGNAWTNTLIFGDNFQARKEDAVA